MEEEITISRDKWKATNLRLKKMNPEEVELKLNRKEIKFDDFDKVEIRVAEVKEVFKVEGSDKLLQFRLDAGDGEDRQILLALLNTIQMSKNWSARKSKS